MTEVSQVDYIGNIRHEICCIALMCQNLTKFESNIDKYPKKKIAQNEKNFCWLFEQPSQINWKIRISKC